MSSTGGHVEWAVREIQQTFDRVIRTEIPEEVTECLSTMRSDQAGSFETSTEVPRFASLKYISPFIPKADPNGPGAKTFKVWSSRRDIVLNTATLTALVVFLFNLIGLVVFRKKYGSDLLYRGNCTTASNLSSAIHVLINVLSTLLMAASNFCMQLLSAPTRKETTEAHRKAVWLDIGVPSIRNLRHIGWRRRTTWGILGFSSLPLHFLYNSVVFTTIPINSIKVLLVTPDFLNDGPVDAVMATTTARGRENLSLPGLSQQGSNEVIPTKINSPWSVGGTRRWDFNVMDGCGADGCKHHQNKVKRGVFNKKLNPVQCLELYTTTSPTSNRSDVLLVSTKDLLDPLSSLPTNNSLLFVGNFTSLPTPGTFWECGTTNTFDCRKRDIWTKDPSIVKDWNVIGYKIDYCLVSEKNVEEFCGLKYSKFILIVVCIMNWSKLVCIFYTNVLHRKSEKVHRDQESQEHRNDQEEILCTIGDGIQSFLSHPDPATENMCLVNEPMFRTRAASSSSVPVWKKIFSKRKTRSNQSTRKSLRIGTEGWAPQILPWRSNNPRWYEAASRRRWICTIIPCCLYVLVGCGFLVNAIKRIGQYSGKTSNFVHYGFGEWNQYATGRLGLVDEMQSSRILYSLLAFANVWHYLLTILYFQANSLVTCIAANVEWHNYSFQRKPLRVSSPTGLQRSSYFISMPWRFGIPMIVTSTFLHWTLSQGVFVLIMEPISNEGVFEDADKFGGGLQYIGFSVWPIITTLIVEIMCIIALVIAGIPRYRGGIPLGATCSAVVAAACHPHPEDKEANKFCVEWGVVSPESQESVSISNQDTCPSVAVAIGTDRGTVVHDRDEQENVIRLKPGHCCFTTARDIGRPKSGSKYS